MSFIVWFTGQPGSGKTTLATELARALGDRRSEIVDGDDLRKNLMTLGFDRRDRDLNVRFAGLLARKLAANRVIALVALVSPYRETRNEVKVRAAISRIPFIEIAVEATLRIRMERRPMLYGKQMDIETIYEPPWDPALRIATDDKPISLGVAMLIDFLRSKKIL